MKRLNFERDGVVLSLADLGGSGPPLLLLHGLAGYAGEWSDSARYLTAAFRVFALDQRGHGESDSSPADISSEALVEDCAAAIRYIGLGPVVLVGQSMGSVVAMLTAAAHPELANVLVMIEGSPDGPDPPVERREIVEHFTETLSAWPVPFANQEAAATFFASKGFHAQTWTGGLEQRDDGLWPRWKVTTLADMMGSIVSRTYWQEWASIKSPTLVILGEHGIYPAGHADHLVAGLRGSKAVTVPGAGHDVHPAPPQAWTQALEHFISDLSRTRYLP